MTCRTLIPKTQSPSGRILIQDGSNLWVLSKCCGSGLMQAGGVYSCIACDETDNADTLFVSKIDLADENVKKLHGGMWAEWLKFWFDFEDVEMEVTW